MTFEGEGFDSVPVNRPPAHPPVPRALKCISRQKILAKNRRTSTINTQYMRNPDMVYILKMEYVSKINFWPKNDGEKGSRKNIFEIPPCARPFSDLLPYFIKVRI